MTSMRCLLAISVLALGIGAAHAETGPDPDAGSAGVARSAAAPRATIAIGGVSVVLIAANGKLHAFVDRSEDNAPEADASVTVVPEGQPPLAMAKVSSGLFVAPFESSDPKRSRFMVSVKSAGGAGQGMAEIVYDGGTPGSAAGRTNLAVLALVALVAGGIGAAIAAFTMRGQWPAGWPDPARIRLQDWGRRVQRFRGRRRTGG